MSQHQTHLLIDGGVVRHHLTDRMALHVHPGVKDETAGVMLREEFFAAQPRAWEPRIDNGYPTVLRDPATGVLRLYYTQFVVDPVSAATSLEQRGSAEYVATNERVVALCIAESDDGVTWVKPELGLVEFEGSTANNIVMMRAHGSGLLLEPDDPAEERRYKLVTRVDDWEGERTMAFAYSADGIHFGPLTPWTGPAPRADSHNAPFRDPSSGLYAITTRIWKDGARVCVTATSPDFEHWSELSDALRGTPPQDQVYSMPVFVHHGQLIGLASVYHEGDRSAEDFDLVDCELATAHAIDGWLRIAPGESLIERGAGTYPSGAFDAGCIYAACPIEIDGIHWIYYFGSNGRHTGFRETGLARARVDLDRLAGYSATDPEQDGRLVVGPFSLAQDDFEVLADASGGHLEWRLVDTQGRVPANASADFQVLETIDGWQALSVGQSALEPWNGRAACFEFRVRGSELFAIRGSGDHHRFR